MERILCQYSSNKSSVLQINTISFAKKNSTFKQMQSDLQIQNYLVKNAEVRTNICIVCYNCETHLPFHEETWLDFLTNACRLIFSQMHAGWFSHKCVQADFLTNACRLIFSHTIHLCLLLFCWSIASVCSCLLYCCTAERFAIVAPLFIEYLSYFHCLLFKVIIYNLIPTIFLVLSIKLIWSLAFKTASAAR